MTLKLSNFNSALIFYRMSFLRKELMKNVLLL
jgi:hypothetical protein